MRERALGVWVSTARLMPNVATLYRSFMMEYDIHTVLDGLTLIATAGVIFCMVLQVTLGRRAVNLV